MHTKKTDTVFLGLTLLLVFGGFFLFLSASLGLLARSNNQIFENVFVSQVVLGLFFGSISMYVMSRIDPRLFRKFSFFIFIAGVVLMLAVFIPGIGFEHNGAKRWIDLRITTFQPSELLKIGFVLYFAAWLSAAKERVRTLRYGTAPFLCLVGIPAVLLALQPDMGTFGVIAAAGTGMFLVAGGRLSHIIVICLLGAVAFYGLVQVKPYLQARIDTFLHPERDPLGAGYQINQSLIAVGSGGVFGRGFGQSIQKFNFLPEPTNDTIFAVASEEFGFAGSTAIILLFVLFALRGYRIAGRAPDRWSRLTVTGIITLIITQSFINIASMVGFFPLTGVPLVFVSHGGTALFVALTEIGIVLNIARHSSVVVGE